MESLFFLVPVVLVILVIAVRFLFWAVNSGQYDDLDTEAHRILFDDDRPADAAEQKSGNTEQTGTGKADATTNHVEKVKGN